MVLQQKGKVVWALQPFSQTEILQQSPAWWSPGPLGSHNNYPPGDLLVLWVHTTITRLVSPGPLGSHNNHPPGDLLVLWVHTAITRLVISWSFMFTQQSPAWWSPGPSGSHSTHPPRDLLVIWVHTTITRLVISWSFGFTQQSSAWWSPGPLGSHNNHPLVICWSLGLKKQSPSWWSLGSSSWHNNHSPGDFLDLWVHTKRSRKTSAAVNTEDRRCRSMGKKAAYIWTLKYHSYFVTMKVATQMPNTYSMGLLLTLQKSQSCFNGRSWN